MPQTHPDPWLVLRTRSRHEHLVDQALQQKQIVSYLPKRKVVRTWQGHRRAVEVPLFPGYLFVRPRAEQYGGMRYIRGSCGLVMSAGCTPARLPEEDVLAVRTLIDSGVALDVDAALVAGQRVKIIAGPLIGLEGQLIRFKNREVLVINVDLVGSSVRVEVAADAICAV